MFELIGGAELWQWDTGRKIDCAGLQAGAKVQFAYSDAQTLSTTVKTVDGANVADVPNQLLLRSGALMVYAYMTEAAGVSYTKYAVRINVQARPKPDDYVYTPTEVQSWQTIRDEMGDLSDLETEDKSSLVAAINEAAQSGGGSGGDSGYLWRPTVSEAGEISWERSKSTTAPAAQNITGPQGQRGQQGETGPQGPQGPAGSDANVTKANVVEALGYTPADAPDAIVCTITGSGTQESPFTCDKTTAELYTANLAGKLIYAKNGGRYIPLFAMQGPQIAYFVQPNQNGNVIGYSVRGDGSVAAIRIDVQSTDDLVTEVSGESTDQQYPSAKAVWDAIPHPTAKTADMTQVVGMDEEGLLFTAPGGGSSGGDGDVWELINDITTSADADGITISADANGAAFALRKILVRVCGHTSETTAQETTLVLNGKWGTSDPYLTGLVKLPKAADNWDATNAFEAEILPGGFVLATQYPNKGNNSNLDAKCVTSTTIASITKILAAGKFAAGARVTLWGG